MFGFLRSALQFMPQLGGGGDGDSPSKSSVHQVQTSDECVGKLSWTPPQSMQTILNKLPAEDRDRAMRIAEYQQQRLAKLLVDAFTEAGDYNPTILDAINDGISSAVRKKLELLER